MNWRIKGVIQKALSAAPGGVGANDLLQRTFGERRHPERHIRMKIVADWLVTARHLRALGMSLQGTRFMEIGTGWIPILPSCFLAGGAARVTSFDLRRHLDPSLTGRMWAVIGEHVDDIVSVSGRPASEVRASLDARPGFEYRAPADATATGLEDNSVDVVFSNSVLEHVPPHVIAAMMREAFRVLRPGGLSIHSVNCADHYAYFDRNVSLINYLRFKTDDWLFWNNELQYQNRLRPQDFIDLSERAGLRTVLADYTPRPALLELLPSLDIAPEFRRYSADQLACTSVDFAGLKP